MKKVVLTSALAIFAFYAQAQVTIDRADIAKSPTKIIYSVDKNYAPTVIENQGSGLTWDFRNLIQDDSSVTIFDDPKNQPDGAKFSTANLAYIADSAAGDVAYIEDSKDSMVVIGTNQVVTDGIRFRQLIFPMSFNTKWVDKGHVVREEAAPQGSLYDSMRFDVIYTYTNNVEAEGTIQLPSGSIDVIKVFTHAETAGDVNVKMGGTWQNINTSNLTDTTYSFYAKNNGDAVLKLSKNDDGTYETKFKKDIVGLASVTKIKQLENAVRLYPNPTTNYLNIKSAKVDSYIITDILGKNIMNGNNTSNIDVSNLAKGNYIIQLFQNNQLMSINKFIKN